MSATVLKTPRPQRLLAATIRRLYQIDEAIRAIHVAAGLVADQIALIESGVLAALDDLLEGEQ